MRMANWSSGKLRPTRFRFSCVPAGDPIRLSPATKCSSERRPDRNRERRHALLVSAEKDDGTVLAARSYFLARGGDLATRPRATDLSGIWELRFEDYGRYYTSWAQVQLTEAGAAASAAYDVRLDSPAAQCVAAPLPSLLVAPYLFEIELRDDAVVLRNERFDAERFIWTDGRGHPEDGERYESWPFDRALGRATPLSSTRTLFADHRAPISGQQGNEGVSAGARKHVVERYRLSEDRNAFDHRFHLRGSRISRRAIYGVAAVVLRAAVRVPRLRLRRGDFSTLHAAVIELGSVNVTRYHGAHA